jgi:hypothetical protein
LDKAAVKEGLSGIWPKLLLLLLLLLPMGIPTTALPTITLSMSPGSYISEA